MEAIFFFIFSFLMVASAIMVVVFKNPVHGAFSLIISFVSLACIYIILNAYFLALIQILVYGGAIMVLFLFIIMLLDLPEESARTTKISALVGAIIVVAIIGLVFILIMNRSNKGKMIKPQFDFALYLENHGKGKGKDNDFLEKYTKTMEYQTLNLSDKKTSLQWYESRLQSGPGLDRLSSYTKGDSFNIIDKKLEERRLPDIQLIGKILFSYHKFHVILISLILLIATIGVVIFSRKTIR